MRVFGFSGSEFLLIVLVIAVVVGPSRLPEYTRTLTRLVKRLRVFIESTKEQIAEEVGPELAELDFSELDPRQYDPRRIVREALGEDLDAIKKDLSQPFKSVKQAAEEASGAAVKDANEVAAADRAKGTLAERIEAKKQEAQAAKEAQATSQVAAVGAATAAIVAQRDAQDEAEAPAEEQPEAPTPSSSPGGVEGADSPSGVDGEASVEETASADSPASSDGAVGSDGEDATSGESPEAAAGSNAADSPSEDSQEAEAQTGAQTAEQAEAVGTAVQAEQVTEAEPDAAPVGKDGEAQTGEHGPDHVAEAQALAAAVPASLGEDGAAASRATRPLSPREIVRAANAASRTRAEAREAALVP